ncbi:MAG TPA: hypothetical protein VNU45_19780 [Rummeliibacillus sp.]|nr:hypothetical protein [Rummeliibacillus sp.]
MKITDDVNVKNSVNYSYYDSPVNDQSLINRDLDELIKIESDLKKLEYLKEQLVKKVKAHMQSHQLSCLETISGKVLIVEMDKRRLDKKLLLSQGISQSIIDMSTVKSKVTQFRITVR